MRCTGRQNGQASLEVLALIPMMVVVIVVAWQLVAATVAAINGQDTLRREGLSGTTTAPTVTVRVPSYLGGPPTEHRIGGQIIP